MKIFLLLLILKNRYFYWYGLEKSMKIEYLIYVDFFISKHRENAPSRFTPLGHLPAC